MIPKLRIGLVPVVGERSHLAEVASQGAVDGWEVIMLT